MLQAFQDLAAAGVAVWLDDLSRSQITSGALTRMVEAGDIVGITTNPTIFSKAISSDESYQDQIRECALRGTAVGETLRLLTAWDVRAACDILRPVYDLTGMRDGRVSIEVDPRISVDPERTAAEARGLWWLIDRPNLFIKIPATQRALPAVTTCIAEGISVNVTLIFSIERYRAVLEAFMAGLEQRAAAGDELSGIQSVASFFVSRVDTEVDRRLDGLGSASEEVRGLNGQVAIANAGLAYEVYEEAAGSDRWQALAAKGASLQRLLWASTGVKDKAFPPTRYVTELVANNTVNTMPAATLKATSNLGAVPANTIGDYDRCRDVTGKLGELGIDLMDVADILEQQGVASFVQSWTDLIASVEEKLKEAGAQVGPGGAIKPAGQATPASAAPNIWPGPQYEK